jgi:hypothetical protein
MSMSSLPAFLLMLVAATALADEPTVRAVAPGQEGTEISRKLAELRARFAADPRVKDAKAAVEAAVKAIDEKLAGDPAIAEARRAEQAAREAVAKAEKVAADDDARVQEHRRALEAARKRASELDLQRRLEEIRAEHARNEARGRLDLRELLSKAQFHPHSPEAAKADPRLAAARKKLDEANAALDKKVKDLAEFKAADQARKEFDDALRANQGVKDAETARRAIDERVAADDQVATQAGKVKAAGEAQGAHRKEIEAIEKKIREAAAAAAAKDPRVAEAAKAMEAARARVGKTIEERVAAERKAREAAQAAWQQKFDAVVAENPEAKALMNEMRSLEERLQKLRNQMGELRRPVSQ